MRTPFTRFLCGLALLLAGLPPSRAAIEVTVSGPGGSRSQSLPDEGGSFDVNLPLTRNSQNTITVTAKDAQGRTVEKQVQLTQLALKDVVVASIRTEPLSVERIEELVNTGVIQLDNPENFNVSVFNIVLVIGGQPIPIVVPIVTPIEVQELVISEPVPNPPGGDGSGGSNVQDSQIIVFEFPSSGGGGGPGPMRIPGVLVIEGRIKTLKEFYSVRLLLMNVSGFFTLKDVMATIQFPDGGLSSTLPSDGIIRFGDILPGDGESPGQKEREWIVRGDEIGIRRVRIDFGGTIAGPGLPEVDPVSFNGAAETDVEVKGPPRLQVHVNHPDFVVQNVPYDITVQITNTSDAPALYSSLDLDVAGAGELVDCSIPDPQTITGCTHLEGPVTRRFGHIFPGQSVLEVFTINPLRSGPITSCIGLSDQNIDLTVSAGVRGCLTGKIPTTDGAPEGIPTVYTTPGNNTQAVSPDSPVVAFFSEKILATSITTGSNGTFQVIDQSGYSVPGEMQFTELNGRDIVIWQALYPLPHPPGFLKDNFEYRIVLSQGITDLDGNPLFNEYSSNFTTTSAINDLDAPTASISIAPPVNPNAVLPGQLITASLYGSDQGSGLALMELRIQDLDTPGALFQLIDKRTILKGSDNPAVFTVDSANLTPGHAYMLKGTVYDRKGNVRESTIGLFIAASAEAPVVVLPPDPTLPILRGVALTLKPQAITGAVRKVEYFLDGAATPVATVFSAPFQTTLGTLALPEGAHTITAVGTDPLGQTASDSLDFVVAANLNEPQVAFTGVQDGIALLQGSRLQVNGTAADPLGIASVAFYLNSTNTTALATNTAPFSVDTASLPPGNHSILLVAENALGVRNSLANPDSVLTFSVLAPVVGAPPPAPVLTLVSHPDAGGEVDITGTSVAGASVEVRNLDRSYLVTVQAAANGFFTARIPAQPGEVVEVLAYRLTQSPNPSPAVTATITAAPILISVALSPSPLSFTTAFGETRQLTLNAQYDNATSANVTGSALFTTSNPSVASVSPGGNVVANGNGSCDLRAVYSGFTSTVSCVVNVITLTGLVGHPAAINLVYAGEPLQVTARGVYSNQTTNNLSASSVAFATADPAVAVINANGLLTAVADGTTRVILSRAGFPPAEIPVTINSALNTTPVATVLTPVDGTPVQRGQFVNVQVRAQDVTGGVVRVELGLSGELTQTFSQFTGFPFNDTTRSFSFSVPALAQLGGTIQLDARAVDAGNRTSAVARVTLNVADLTPPVVVIQSPTNATPFNPGDLIDLEVLATDAGGVTELRYLASDAFAASGSSGVFAANSSTNRTFQIPVPFGVPGSNLVLRAIALDGSGNAATSTPVQVVLTGADITPPGTIATATSDPGATAVLTVSYAVTNGLSDLDHVALYFRRNGIGTFNRYTGPLGNTEGEYVPQSGASGTIVFDSTRMGGDGTFEFYTVGVDRADNREAAPAAADQSRAIASGTPWTVITSPTTILAGNTSFDNQNIRVQNTTLTVLGTHNFLNLELLNNAVLTSGDSTAAQSFGLDFGAWSVSVDATSRIDVSGRGFVGGNASGLGSQIGQTKTGLTGAVYPSGGSHGGVGAVYPGTATSATYGDLFQPLDPGAGGSGGNGGQLGGDGGGWMRMVTLHVMADGGILSNGANGTGGFSGSGAGGSVLLETGTLSGTGVLSANGGGFDEAGGGGRVAVLYRDVATKNTGLIQALGGSGTYGQSGNGTVFLRRVGASNGTLVVDANGQVRPFTGLPFPPGTVFDNIILRNGARVEVNEAIEVTGRIALENNAVLRHVAELEAGLAIIATHVEVDASSAIDASGMGYPGGRSGSNSTNGLYSLTLHRQQGGAYLDGGSYGGLGGRYSGAVSSMPVYGVPWAPVYLGSGGGPSNGGTRSGNGGGRVDIEASGSVTVNGSIRVNGENGLGSFGSSGSGGSIWIRTSLFKGTGTIQAHGGGYDQAGGGGRVAVEYAFTDAAADFNDFTAITAIANPATYAQGSAGTVWLKQGTGQGHLIVDNQRASPIYNFTPLSPLGFGAVSSASTDTLVLDPAVPAPLPGALVGAWLQPDENNPTLFEVLANTSSTLTVRVTGPALNAIAAPGDRYSLRHRMGDFTLRNGASVMAHDAIEVSGTLHLAGQTVLTHASAATNTFPYLRLDVGTLRVDATAQLTASGRGSPGGLLASPASRQGTPTGALQYQGGMHGGYGGRYPGYAPTVHSFGDPTQPVDYGGGGGGGNSGSLTGGSGGGRVRVLAGQVVVDGTVEANGANGTGGFTGSGAGGSIWITANEVSGSGLILANGAGLDEAGGGGRIAVDTQVLALPENNIRAWPTPATYAQAGAGSVYLKRAGQTRGDLVLRGNGTGAPIDSTPYPDGIQWDNLRLDSGVRVVASNAVLAAQSILLTTNSILTHVVQTPNGLHVEADTVRVDATSSLDVSGRGYYGGNAGTQGGNATAQSKPGVFASRALTGGSHGGVGGWYNNNDPTYGPVGDIFGSAREPVDFGGGGGGYASSPSTPAGNGGGVLRLISRHVEVEGALRANGANGNGSFTGAGAGGSIWVTADTLSGAGQITANGGGGDESGGGGRIALDVENQSLTLDQVQASSSPSTFGNGGAGTLYFASSSQPAGRLVIDGRAVATNGDRAVFPNEGQFDEILIRRNAQVKATNTVQVAGFMRIESTSYLTHPIGHSAGLRVESGPLEIDATSSIDVSGRGYYGGFSGTQVGTRVGQSKPGFAGSEWLSGGSHGGIGGWYNNQDPTYGPPGPSYGDAREPVDFGAGGGAYNSPGTPGGTGGGKARVISSSLLVEGAIRANGLNGNGGYTGAGAGGSVWITSPSVTGSGSITANGGGGDESGGGGRVAIYSSDMQLASSQVQASSSGSTFGNGGSGTLYFQGPADPLGHLVIDARGLAQVRERTVYPDDGTFSRVTLRNRAQVIAGAPVLATGAVSIESNSYLTHPEERLAGLRIESGSFNLDATSSLDVTGRGYPGGYRGSNTNHTGVAKSPLVGSGNRTGGSHGGLGRAFSGFGPPNATYGDALQPVDLGAGGGANPGSAGNPGGSGGGAIRLITGPAVIDGQILANGQNGAGTFAGSGAGGSVWITATELSGGGLIHANGGGFDESGGGGRIAVYYVTSTFNPASITASGSGSTYGGTSDNGTVTLQAVLPGLADPHAAAGLRISRIEVLPNGRMKVYCNGDVAGCRVHLEKAASTEASTWTPLGYQTADGTGVVFELPVESGSVFLRLRME